MVEDSGAAEWDFLTLVAWWNLYVLPLCLTIVGCVVLLKSRTKGSLTPERDGLSAVTFVAAIQFVLGLRGGVRLAQELSTLRLMGIPQSFPVVGLLMPAISVIVDPLLGLGLLARHRGARRCAMGWYLFWSLIAVWVMMWMWRYGVKVEPAAWPDELVSKGLAPCLLVTMVFPRVRLLFGRRPLAHDRPGGEPDEPEPSAWPVVSLPVLLLLVITISTLVVEVADWVYRLATTPEAVA